MAVYTAIDDPEAYFQVKTYTGDDAGTHALTFDGDTDMAPNLIWIAGRAGDDATQEDGMFDTVRGISKFLRTDTGAAESTMSDGVTAVGSDGFTVGAENKTNGAGTTYVAWCWNESATAGFDIVAYTGNGTDDTDISHSLSAVPHLIIVKNRDATQPWRIQHKALGETFGLILNDTTVKDNDDTAWSDEAPTSSVFTLGTSANTNNNTEDFIAYLFSEKQGFSKFGSYKGSGNADGPFIYTGLRPAFVLIRNVDSVEGWHIFDNKRNGYNAENRRLYPHSAEAEGDASHTIDMLSNGFKVRSATEGLNKNDDTIIFAAFAEAPFVNSNGVPCNAR